jgi:integrase
LPQVYASEQLRVFFASLAAKESKLALTFELILKTGLLEQEAVYLRWKDVDLTRGILRIRSNPTFGFIVKDKEQREITIPADLLTVGTFAMSLNSSCSGTSSGCQKLRS